jgi:hypothetical protein
VTQFSDLFPTLYVQRQGEQPGYYIVEMRSWDYSGPLAPPEVNAIEMELPCTRAEHPWVHQWGWANSFSQWHPRVLGTPQQGLTGANRNPTALLLRFDTSQRMLAFTQAWAARQQG